MYVSRVHRYTYRYVRGAGNRDRVDRVDSRGIQISAARRRHGRVMTGRGRCAALAIIENIGKLYVLKFVVFSSLSLPRRDDGHVLYYNITLSVQLVQVYENARTSFIF